MKRRRAFIPAVAERLECRLVLSHGHVSRGLSVVVSGLSPRQQVLNAHQQPVIAEVNQAFSSFVSDYGQARGTYFSSIVNQASSTDAAKSANTAFVLYTAQRVELLAQQLVSSFLQTPQGTSRSGKTTTLTRLVATKIINPTGKNGPTGLLFSSLTSTIPPAGASASTESLYMLSQNYAIQAANVTVVNALNVVKNGDFGNKYSKSHQHF